MNHYKVINIALTFIIITPIKLISVVLQNNILILTQPKPHVTTVHFKDHLQINIYGLHVKRKERKTCKRISKSYHIGIHLTTCNMNTIKIYFQGLQALLVCLVMIQL